MSVKEYIANHQSIYPDLDNLPKVSSLPELKPSNGQVEKGNNSFKAKYQKQKSSDDNRIFNIMSFDVNVKNSIQTTSATSKSLENRMVNDLDNAIQKNDLLTSGKIFAKPGKSYENVIEEKNLNKTIAYYKSALVQGFNVLPELIFFLLHGGDEEKAQVFKFNKDFSLNDPLILKILSDHYSQDHGNEKHHKLAFDFFKIKAKMGFVKAQSHLGYCYVHGIGCVKNDKLASENYKKAAGQGHEKAIKTLKKLKFAILMRFCIFLLESQNPMISKKGINFLTFCV